MTNRWAGSLFKHVNCRSVAIKVLKSFFIPEKDAWSLKVQWYYVSSHSQPMGLSLTERILIKKEDVKNWKRMSHYDKLPKRDPVLITIEDGQVIETPVK